VTDGDVTFSSSSSSSSSRCVRGAWYQSIGGVGGDLRALAYNKRPSTRKLTFSRYQSSSSLPPRLLILFLCVRRRPCSSHCGRMGDRSWRIIFKGSFGAAQRASRLPMRLFTEVDILSSQIGFYNRMNPPTLKRTNSTAGSAACGSV